MTLYNTRVAYCCYAILYQKLQILQLSYTIVMLRRAKMLLIEELLYTVLLLCRAKML